MKLPRLVRVALATLFVGAALAFIALTVARSWGTVRAYPWELDVPQLLLSTLALVGVLSWGVWLWTRFLAHFGYHDVPLRRLLRVWFLSSLGRYIPGAIWQFVGAAHLGRLAGLPRSVSLTSMVIQLGFSLLSAGIVSGLALLLPGGSAELGVVLVSGSAAAGLLIVHPRALGRILAIGSRLSRRELSPWNGSWRTGVGLLLLSVVTWILYGCAFWLLVDALVDIPLAALPMLIGVNALSFLAGYFAIVAPAGWGVREAAMTLLLAPVLPAGVAGVVALASRLWVIAADLAGSVIAVLADRQARDSKYAESDSESTGA